MKSRFIVLLADGARYDVFREHLDQGNLPNIEEVFLQRGNFAKATSAFPSTTGPAYMPFLTGCFPGTCNVPGIRWFDKDLYANTRFSMKRYRSYVGFESFLMNHDMKRDYPTLFELFPKSYTIFSTINRGVPSKGNLTPHCRLWYWYYAHLTDRWHMVDAAALNKALSVIRKDFEFLFVVFPGIDEYTHLSHCRHPNAKKAYQFVDEAVGRMAAELKKEGKQDETAMFIVSDHGLSQTDEHFGVASFIEEKGIKTFYYPKIFKRNFKVASMVSGNGMLNLYFKSNGSWAGRSSEAMVEEQFPGLLQDLIEQPAVDLALSQDSDGWVRARGKGGVVRILEKDSRLHWENLEGDVLELGEKKGDLDFLQALEKTGSTPYPDSLLQISQLFRSHRTGDVVLSAAKGYDLRKRFEYPEHKSSHGALHDEHMLIPLFSSEPMKRDLVRSADLFPSILELSGRKIPENIDGKSFV